MGEGVQLGSAYGVIEIDASGVRQGVQQAEQSLSGMGRQFAAIGATLTLGVTAPLVAAGKKALDTAMDFQSSMAMFQAVSSATAAQMNQVRQVAVQLGADMALPATSAADAGTAMTELAKAGLSVENALAAARGTLQLAAAGSLSEAEAAKVAANALNMFGLAGTEATRVANLLAAAANSSSAEVRDVATGLQMAGSVFASAKIPLEDLVTAIAEMANKGIAGSDAGTSLKTMLMALQAPSKKAKQVMAELGISIYDARGQMRPFRDIIEQFTTKTANLTQAERDYALATIFGTDAVRAANNVLMGGTAAFDAMREAVTREGAASELAAAKMAGLKGAFAGLRSQLETVGLTVAGRFLPAIESIVRRIAEVVASFLNVPVPIQNAVLAFLTVIAAAGPVIGAIGGIRLALGLLSGPIGAVILAVGLLAAAFGGNFLGIRDRVTTVAGHIQSAIRQLVIVFDLWKSKTGSTEQAVGATLDALAQYAPGLAPLIDIFRRFVPTILEVGAKLDYLKNVFFNVYRATGSLPRALASTVKEVVKLVPALGPVANGFEALRPALTGVWTFITGFIRNQIGFVASLVRAGMALLRGDWDGAWGYLGEALQAKFGGIIDFVTGGTGSLAAAFAGLRPAVDAFIGAFQSAWATVSTLVGAIIGSVTSSAGAVRANLGSAWQAAVGLITGAVTSIASIVGSVLGGIRTFVAQHGAEIQAFLAHAWVRVSNIISLAVQLLQRVVGGALQNIAGFLAAHQGLISGTLGAIWAAFRTVIDVVLAVVEAFLKLPAPVQDTLLALAGVALAIGPAKTGLSALISTVGTIGSTVSDALVYIRLFGGALKDLPALLGVLVRGTSAWTTLTGIGAALSSAFGAVSAVVGPALAAVGAALAPLLPVILAVAAVAALLYAAFKTNFLGFRDLCNEIGAAISAIFNFIKTVVTGFWQFLTGQISWSQFTSQVSTAFTGLQGQLAGIWENIKQIVANAWEQIKTGVGNAATQIGTTLSSAWNNLQKAAGAAWENVKTTISQKAGDILRAVLRWLDDTLVKIENFDLRAAAEHFFGTVLPGIAAKIGQGIKDVGQFLADIGRSIASFDLKGAAETFFGTILPGIAAKVGDAVKDVGLFLGDVAKKISGFDLKAAAETAFATVVGGIGAKVGNILKSVGDFLEDAAKKIAGFSFKSHTLQAIQTVVVGILEKVGDILQAVGGFLTDIGAKITSFDLGAAGRALIQGFINGISSMASAVWQAAVNIAQQAWDAITGKQGIDAHSPSRKGIQAGEWLGEGLAVGLDASQPVSLDALGRHVKAIVDELARLANAVLEPAAVQSAKAVTDPLAAILENVAKMVEGIDKLGALKLPVSIGAQLQAVSDAVTTVVYHYQYMADHVVAGNAVWSAKAFTDPVGTIFENIKKIVDGTEALAEFISANVKAEQISAPLGVLQGVIAEWLRRLNEVAEKTPDLGAAAAALAANAGPAVELVGQATAALDELLDSARRITTANQPQVITALDRLDTFLRELVSRMGQAGREIKVELQDAARALAENAGPVVGLVKSAAEAFDGIMTGFQSLGSLSAWSRMVQGIEALRVFLRELIDRLGRTGAALDPDLQVAAKGFADNADSVMGLVKNAVEAFNAVMTGFQPLMDAAGRTWLMAGLETLRDFLRELVVRIGGIAAGFVRDTALTDLAEKAGAFAEQAGPVIGQVKGAVEAFAAVAGLDVPTTNAAIEKFNDQLGGLTGFIYGLLRQLGFVANSLANDPVLKDLAAKAKTFAEQAAPVVGLVKTAVEGFAGIAVLDVPSTNAAIARFNDQLGGLTGFINGLLRQLGFVANSLGNDPALKDLAAKAQAFAAQAGPALNLVKVGVEGFAAVAGLDVPTTSAAIARFNDQLGGLTGFINGLVRQLGFVANSLANDPVLKDLAAKAQAFAAQAGPVLSLVKGAVEAMTEAAKPLAVVPAGNLTGLADFMRGLVDAVGRAAGQVAGDLQSAAKTLAENAGPVVGLVKNTVEAMGALVAALPTPATGNLALLAGFIAALTLAVAGAAGGVNGELQTAAKTLAENAGPIIGLVKNTLDAMTALAGEIANPPTENLIALSGFIASLTTTVAGAASAVKSELQTAAKAFAENAGPAVALVKNAVEAMMALTGDIGSPSPLNFTALSSFLYSLITALQGLAAQIDGDLLKAVRAFAENTGPVLNLMKEAFDLVRSLPELAKTLTSWQYSKLPKDWLTQLTTTLQNVITGLAQAKISVPESDIAAAKAFSDQMSTIIGWLKSGIDAIQGLMSAKRIGPWLAERIVQDVLYLLDAIKKGAGQLTPAALTDSQTFAQRATAVAQELVRGLTAFSGASGTTGLRDLGGVLTSFVATVRGAVAELAAVLATLPAGAYTAGYSWASQLAAGIQAGLPLIQAALQAVANLFPHSPAKEGPLRQTPDWQTWMLGGLDQAASNVAQALGAVALTGGMGAAAYAGAPVTNTVNLGPVTVREEADIQRLAAAVGDVLAGQAHLYRRLNTSWVIG